MASKAADKISEGLTQILEGLELLEESLNEDSDESEDEEYLAGLVAEFRTAVEAVIDTDDHSLEDVASVVSALLEAVQEIDPNVFDNEEHEDGDDDDKDDDDDNDDEDDDDDFSDSDD